MIIPFNALGIWFEAKDISGWRVLVHHKGTDYLYDNKIYTQELAETIAMMENERVHMKGIGDHE